MPQASVDREINPIVTSHQTDISQVSIDDMLVSQRNHLPSSCATLQPCHLERKLVPLVVWCRALSWNSACQSVAFILFSRLPELSPPVQRLCRVETKCSRSDPDCRLGPAGPLGCDRIQADSKRHQKLTTSCSWRLAMHRGILSTRTPSLVVRKPKRPQA